MVRLSHLVLLSGAALALAACGSNRGVLGGGKSSPDEFAIVTKAPLTVPPDFALRPPKPGETRPEALSTSERTRQLLIGDVNAAPPSNGELALLESAGAVEADSNIREILDAENGGRAEKNASLANQLIFWDFAGGEIDDTDAPLRVEDAEAWKQERAEAIESVTGGDPVVISRDRRILNLPGVR
ncbi:hypothetical protein PB2503_02702 [Parvularcula bermudensis HTCC2503]|uniref:DUF3035 domain-containing protein n=1 Tax=Parvularcula bermudensis (strain ATCC BAA-594 / HTCC2503 / KCTC 12087) TaxID=314260 RepID=E0TCM8_PARBH|nr:DUF3035 domain-containing protein [Parvularcula bermudensis]ADM08617.1 hypothetical protein PB2503_02702 [Parvularcula bermudensis HTCC2503]